MRDESYYDVALICMNGHVVNASTKTSPSHNTPFCEDCGAQTISSCLKCEEDIRGKYHVPLVIGGGYDLPSYCHNCGQPYPWTESKIQTAIDIFVEFGGLDDVALEQTKKDLNNIAKDVPQTELSAMRIKRIWANGTKLAYNVIMEFASKTAAEMLKQP